MPQSLTLAAALAGLVLSSGAVASPKDSAPAVPASAPDGAQPKAKETRYCVVSTVTGSRIPVKECKTRKDWLAEGFDPLNP